MIDNIRKRLILDLKQEGKSIREIAKETNTSSRDIENILMKTTEEIEAAETSIRRASSAAEAYKRFDKGARPLDVAIELKLRQSEVTIYHEEYLKLIALSKFLYVYSQIKEDPRSFVRLYELVNDAGMNDQQ